MRVLGTLGEAVVFQEDNDADQVTESPNGKPEHDPDPFDDHHVLGGSEHAHALIETVLVLVPEYDVSDRTSNHQS